MSDEFISIREFARRVGCSDTSVLKARGAGKITEDCFDYSNPKRPKINALRALECWGKNYAPSFNQSDNVQQAIKSVEVKEPLRLIRPLTKKELVLEERPKQELPKKIESEEDFDEEDSYDDSDEIKERPTWVKKGATLTQAKTIAAIHQANIAQIEVLEAKKKLISRVKAEKAFYDVGIIIRTKLQGIPDKVIDNLRAFEDRSEAHVFLYNAIAECLEELSAIKL